MDLKGRSFLTLKDFTAEEIEYLIDLAAELKEKKKQGVPVDTLKGRNVALIFEKTSTRTRCSFEVAAHDLGMGTTYLDPKGSQIGKKRVSVTRPGFWEESMTALSTADSDRRSWRNWQNTQVFRCGMALQMNTIPHRCWLTF